MESEDNGSLGNADALVLSPGAAGSQTARVAGSLDVNDSAGDYFALGTLGAGVTVNLQLTQPSSSPLVGQLTLYKEGTYVWLGNEGETNCSYAIPSGEGGQYSARVKAVGTSWGLLAQYVLNVNVTNDFVRPVITGVSLGSEGSTNQGVVDRFTMTFSEDLYAASVNTLANYELRGAGTDGLFGNDDDVLSYLLSPPSYSSGLSNSFLINNGPLQPGRYRFTATTNLMDRAGNRLAADFVRTFWVAPQTGFTMENRDNDNSAGATPLPLAEEPSGLRWRVGLGKLTTSSDQDWWVFNGNAGQVVTVAIDGPGDPSGGNWCLYLYRQDGSSLASSCWWYRGALGPVTLPAGEEYRVRVSQNAWSSAEYRLRVSVAVPPVQMESEDNGSLGNADALTLSPGVGGSQTARVAGCVETNDTAGDYFLLGTLGGGVTVNLDLTQPASSPLVGQLTLYKDGVYVWLGNDGETHSSYVIPTGQGGQYYAKVKAAGTSGGLLSQYVLNVNVGTGGTPTITSTSPLPAATVAAAYSYTLQATGGSPPYVWQLVSSLPAGLVLSTNTGTISGSPTTAGVFGFSVRARGTNGLETVKAFALEVYAVNPFGYHTADFRDRRWAIDATEANRVLAYWRAGAYHLDPSGWDGFAGGTGNTNGARHKADYSASFWVIDGAEANRVLSYWRAGAYHADTNGLDGYAPGAGAGVMDALRNEKVLADILTVRQDAPATYAPDGLFAVSLQMKYTATPLSLLWRPRLPAGWTITSVAGDGNPEVNRGEVIWTGAIPTNKLGTKLTVHVPAEERGGKQIEGDLAGQFAGMPNPAILAMPELMIGEPGSGFSEITEVERPANGQITLQVRAEAGRRYQLQASEDLVTWAGLATADNPSGTLEFKDSGTATLQRRFYRVCLLP
jgi:hypothetical protein